MKTSLPQPLEDYCKTFSSEFNRIPKDRKLLLQSLGHYMAGKVKNKQAIKLVVICTHNSRRSHIGQLWLQTAAYWFGIPGVATFSGGTEATAFNYRAVAAMRRVGFELEQISDEENPIYQTRIPLDAASDSDLRLFSKTYDSPPNPQKDFAAIMVCSEADANCPYVPGAEARFSIPFEDPKNFDDSPQETEQYDARVRQIGREFFFAVYYATEMIKT